MEVIKVFSLVGFFGAEDPRRHQPLSWAVHETKTWVGVQWTVTPLDVSSNVNYSIILWSECKNSVSCIWRQNVMFTPSWSLFWMKEPFLFPPTVFPQTSSVLLCFWINLSHYCLYSSSSGKIFLVSESLQIQGPLDCTWCLGGLIIYQMLLSTAFPVDCLSIICLEFFQSTEAFLL